ncbi:hypothetical protein BSU04_22235 [Caballeronia sordidicola]|uniref:Uncharacterized protein n=1 Tax=Caballeronia sordidicola TaxID=196367 RepID=A0A226X0I3_CABSO|nr:hypothetical protein BSU04_22235 [Caballeronia sordidicola]
MQERISRVKMRLRAHSTSAWITRHQPLAHGFSTSLVAQRRE